MIVTDHDDDLMSPKPIHNMNSLNCTPDRNTILVLKKEYQNLMLEPIEGITAHPVEYNICIWYFLINGPTRTPFEGGLYLGVIIFPPNFPYSPPEIQLISPNGRFKTRKSICLTLSSFHSETWNVSWTFEKIIVGLVSFMASNESTTGCYKDNMVTEEEKIYIAEGSKEWLYRRCAIFKRMFPDEYQILHRVFSSDLPDHIGNSVAKTVLNEPVQNSTRSTNLNKRISDYIENFSQIDLVLLEYHGTKRNEIIQKFFSLSTSRYEIKQLELFHSPYYQQEEIMDYNYDSEDRDTDEVEFYSTEED